MWLVDPETGHIYSAAARNLPPFLQERVLAGLTGLVKRREPKTGSLRLPLIIASFIMALAAQLMDRILPVEDAAARGRSSPRGGGPPGRPGRTPGP